MWVKKYTSSREFAVVSVVIVAIAFSETSGPIWSVGFLREFATNLLGYAAISVIAMIIAAPFFRECKKEYPVLGSIATHVEKQHTEKQTRKEKILEILRERESVSNNDIERVLNVSDTTATNYLQELEQEGLIEQIGERGRFVSYRLKT